METRSLFSGIALLQSGQTQSESRNGIKMERIPARKKNRLSSVTYAENGAYFITVCTKDKRNLFWTMGAAMRRPPDCLTSLGRIADDRIRRIHDVYDGLPAHLGIHRLQPRQMGGRLLLPQRRLVGPKRRPPSTVGAAMRRPHLGSPPKAEWINRRCAARTLFSPSKAKQIIEVTDHG